MVHPAPASKARMRKFGHRQVFGLAGTNLFLFLLAVASQFAFCEPVHSIRRSFLLTAAGQFRILTGFPQGPNVQAIDNGWKPNTRSQRVQ